MEKTIKLAYPVTTPDCRGNIKALMEGYETSFFWMKEHGYDGVELLIRDADAVDVAYLDRCLKQWDLQIAAIGTSPMQIEDKLFLLHPDTDNRREALRRCDSFLKLCGYFKVPALMGKYRGQIMDNEPYCSWKYLGEIMEVIGEKAKKLGVNVLIEPQNATNINNLNTIEETLAWIADRSCDNLGILADIYHMGITETSIETSLKKAGNRVGFIHMSDSERAVPGDGNLPVLSVLSVLSDMNYQGYVSLEINQNPDSRTACARAAEYLSACTFF